MDKNFIYHDIDEKINLGKRQQQQRMKFLHQEHVSHGEVTTKTESFYGKTVNNEVIQATGSMTRGIASKAGQLVSSPVSSAIEEEEYSMMARKHISQFVNSANLIRKQGMTNLSLMSLPLEKSDIAVILNEDRFKELKEKTYQQRMLLLTETENTMLAKSIELEKLEQKLFKNPKNTSLNKQILARKEDIKGLNTILTNTKYYNKLEGVSGGRAAKLLDKRQTTAKNLRRQPRLLLKNAMEETSNDQYTQQMKKMLDGSVPVLKKAKVGGKYLGKNFYMATKWAGKNIVGSVAKTEVGKMVSTSTVGRGAKTFGRGVKKVGFAGKEVAKVVKHPVRSLRVATTKGVRSVTTQATREIKSASVKAAQKLRTKSNVKTGKKVLLKEKKKQGVFKKVRAKVFKRSKKTLTRSKGFIRGFKAGVETLKGALAAIGAAFSAVVGVFLVIMIAFGAILLIVLTDSETHVSELADELKQNREENIVRKIEDFTKQRGQGETELIIHYPSNIQNLDNSREIISMTAVYFDQDFSPKSNSEIANWINSTLGKNMDGNVAKYMKKLQNLSYSWTDEISTRKEMREKNLTSYYANTYEEYYGGTENLPRIMLWNYNTSSNEFFKSFKENENKVDKVYQTTHLFTIDDSNNITKVTDSDSYRVVIEDSKKIKFEVKTSKGSSDTEPTWENIKLEANNSSSGIKSLPIRKNFVLDDKMEQYIMRFDSNENTIKIEKEEIVFTELFNISESEGEEDTFSRTFKGHKIEIDKSKPNIIKLYRQTNQSNDLENPHHEAEWEKVLTNNIDRNKTFPFYAVRSDLDYEGDEEIQIVYFISKGKSNNIIIEKEVVSVESKETVEVRTLTIPGQVEITDDNKENGIRCYLKENERRENVYQCRDVRETIITVIDRYVDIKRFDTLFDIDLSGNYYYRPHIGKAADRLFDMSAEKTSYDYVSETGPLEIGLQKVTKEEAFNLVGDIYRRNRDLISSQGEARDRLKNVKKSYPRQLEIFVSLVNGGRINSWNNINEMANESSDFKGFLKAMLSSELGKEIQDSIYGETIGNILNSLRNKGIRNEKVLVFFGEMVSRVGIKDMEKTPYKQMIDEYLSIPIETSVEDETKESLSQKRTLEFALKAWEKHVKAENTPEEVSKVIEAYNYIKTNNELKDTYYLYGEWAHPLNPYVKKYFLREGGTLQKYLMTSPYGYRYLDEKLDFHHGVDIGVPLKTPVLAAKAGKVVSAAFHNCGGNIVVIQTQDNNKTFFHRYAHLDSMHVSAGEDVVVGQIIGYSGGEVGKGDICTTGPHLHFEMRKDENSPSHSVDPEDYIDFGEKNIEYISNKENSLQNKYYNRNYEWAGWTKENRDWAKTLYSQDWGLLYGLYNHNISENIKNEIEKGSIFKGYVNPPVIMETGENTLTQIKNVNASIIDKALSYKDKKLNSINFLKMILNEAVPSLDTNTLSLTSIPFDYRFYTVHMDRIIPGDILWSEERVEIYMGNSKTFGVQNVDSYSKTNIVDYGSILGYEIAYRPVGELSIENSK